MPPGVLGHTGAVAADARAGARGREWVADYLAMVAGAAAMAFGVSSLILPAHLADGGITGVAIIIHYLTGLGVGPLYAALNLPLLVWAWYAQGSRFVWRTVVGVALVSSWMVVFAPVRLNPHDRLLSALYGGLLVGSGLGVILRVGGSTGGVDILARHLYLKTGLSYNHTYLASDVAVLAAVAVWVGLPAAMYAWVATNVTGRVVAFVAEGPRRGRLAFIVAADQEAVRRRIVEDLDRGATLLLAQGAYTGRPRPLLMVAVAQREVVRLRTIVRTVDPDAFVVVLPATEVLGEGFSLLATGGQPDPAGPRPDR